MKSPLILGTSLALIASASMAEQITVMSWGGTYSQSQVEAYQRPFTEETGINVVAVDSDNPAVPIKAQVEAGNVTIDVVDIEYADAIRLCDEGLLEEIDPTTLPPAPDGTSATEDFLLRVSATAPWDQSSSRLSMRMTKLAFQTTHPAPSVISSIRRCSPVNAD